MRDIAEWNPTEKVGGRSIESNSLIEDRWESGMQQTQPEKTKGRCLGYGIDVVIVNGKCTEDCTLEDCALSSIDDTDEAESLMIGADPLERL